MQVCGMCKKKRDVAAVVVVHKIPPAREMAIKETKKTTYVCQNCYFVAAALSQQPIVYAGWTPPKVD